MNNENSSPKKRHSVTITDVARAADVSCATVSRVLSGYEFVRETTRNRVMEAVKRLGYVANLQARSLASGRSQFIGLLVPNLDNGYVGTITQGIDQELAQANYDLMLYTSHHYPDREALYVSAIASGLTDGLLLISPLVPATYLDALREQNFPYILIDQRDATENSSVVEATNWQGAYEATCYLSQLGHTRIAFITGSLVVRSAVDRLRGYKAALANCDIPVREELVIEGDFQQQTGYEATKSLLQSVDPPPTAIFASNDLSAFGTMDAARECGLGIPDDISIIGFDDIPQASFVYPKLTTVRQPLEQMGKVAAKMLLERIEDQSRLPQRVTLATQLVIRDSCGPYQDKHRKHVEKNRRQPTANELTPFSP
ncbi:MAG: LacI family DNA-binding transcriptional regulator [Anaerolineales bacterium]|nr:LacI family DNA-binding transcriptional regulator [Anaerolineales bacterium]